MDVELSQPWNWLCLSVTLRDPEHSRGYPQERVSLLPVLGSPAKPSQESSAQVRSSVPRACLLPSSVAAPRLGSSTSHEGRETVSRLMVMFPLPNAGRYPEASSREGRMHREEKAACWMETELLNSLRHLASQFLSTWGYIFILKMPEFPCNCNHKMAMV